MTKQKIITTTPNQQILWSMMYLNTIPIRNLSHKIEKNVWGAIVLGGAIVLLPLTHIQLKNKLWTTVAFLHCCNLIWGLANNNYSLYFLQFLTDSVNSRLCYIFIPYHTVLLYMVGPLSKLTETSFFCWRSHKYELLQFVWYWITTQ